MVVDPNAGQAHIDSIFDGLGGLLQQLIDAEIQQEGYGSASFTSKLVEQFFEGVLGSAAMGATMGLVGGLIQKGFAIAKDAIAIPKGLEMTLEDLPKDAEALHRSQMFSDQQIQNKLQSIQQEPKLYDYNMQSINNWLNKDAANSAAFNETHGKQMFGDQFIDTDKMLADWKDSPDYQQFRPVDGEKARAAQVKELLNANAQRPLQLDTYRQLLKNPSKDFRLLDGSAGTYYDKQLQKYGRWLADDKLPFKQNKALGHYEYELDEMKRRAAERLVEPGGEADGFIASHNTPKKLFKQSRAVLDAAEPQLIKDMHAEQGFNLPRNPIPAMDKLVRWQNNYAKAPAAMKALPRSELEKIASTAPKVEADSLNKLEKPATTRAKHARTIIDWQDTHDQRYAYARKIASKAQPKVLRRFEKAGGQLKDIAQNELKYRGLGHQLLDSINKQKYNSAIAKFNGMPAGADRLPTGKPYRDLVKQLHKFDPEGTIEGTYQKAVQDFGRKPGSVDGALQDANLFQRGLRNTKVGKLLEDDGYIEPLNYTDNQMGMRYKPLLNMKPLPPLDAKNVQQITKPIAGPKLREPIDPQAIPIIRRVPEVPEELLRPLPDVGEPPRPIVEEPIVEAPIEEPPPQQLVDELQRPASQRSLNQTIRDEWTDSMLSHYSDQPLTTLEENQLWNETWDDFMKGLFEDWNQMANQTGAAERAKAPKPPQQQQPIAKSKYVQRPPGRMAKPVKIEDAPQVLQVQPAQPAEMVPTNKKWPESTRPTQAQLDTIPQEGPTKLFQLVNNPKQLINDAVGIKKPAAGVAPMQQVQRVQQEEAPRRGTPQDRVEPETTQQRMRRLQLQQEKADRELIQRALKAREQAAK